jgi:peptidoglycan/xylan/chitin deacetylase (PgdA/CDA1 family)
MRETIKQVAFQALEWSGLNALARARQRDNLLVLAYHSVLEDGSESEPDNYYSVGTGEFAEHLEFLCQHYRPVRASDVEAWASGDHDLPQRAVLVTFDDGLRNNLTHAAPVLKSYGVPAILFLATVYLGGSRILWPCELYELAMRWPNAVMPDPSGGADIKLDGTRKARSRELVSMAKRLPASTVEAWLARLRAETPLPDELSNRGVYAFLTWEEAAQLPGYGFEIGSHTVNHWIVTRCTREELQWELVESKREIERRLGVPCTSFCYPNGGASDWSRETAEAVKAAGYRAAYAVPDRIQSRAALHAYAIDRMTVAGGVSQLAFRARVSGTINTIRALL